MAAMKSAYLEFALTGDLHNCPQCGHWLHGLECSYWDTSFPTSYQFGKSAPEEVVCNCTYRARPWDYEPYYIQEIPDGTQVQIT